MLLSLVKSVVPRCSAGTGEPKSGLGSMVGGATVTAATRDRSSERTISME